MLPNVVIIGAQKSATSYLQACLHDHPQIYMYPGEVSFFCSPDYEQGNISALERLFENKHFERLGIKRADYIGRPEVPPRISRHLPRALLLAVLRNPVERALSAYYHNVKHGFIPPIDPEVGLRKIIGDPYFVAQYPRAPEVIEYGFYHRYLSLYDEYFANSQILILLYEDIVSSPLDTIQTAYSFLGVNHGFVPKSLAARPQKVLYNLTRLRFLTGMNRLLYSYNEPKTRLFPKENNTIGKKLAAMMILVDRLLLSRMFRSRRPRPSPDLRQILYDIYAKDIVKLERLISRDLSNWHITEPNSVGQTSS